MTVRFWLVVRAGMHSDLSYTRFACLQEDLNTLSGVLVKAAKEDKGLLLDTLYAQMQLLRPGCKSTATEKEMEIYNG